MTLSNESLIEPKIDFLQLTAQVAAVVEKADYKALQELLRNSPAPVLSQIIRSLPIEKQFIVLRVLPRSLASTAFEFLSIEEQQTLLKSMGNEEITKILNAMAPDDRTTLFEELPAAITKQMLALLSAEERTIAQQLLGYPENSVGRLMTPNYVEVHQDWTVQQVLEFVREHGQDSETLNVIYVVDEKGQLIDDIRIRELLLAPTNKIVSELMDYRYVSLKATERQGNAIQVFKQEDRKALPVIDSAGLLIGIVTIDDVLMIAEEAATKEIQRIGGSESLDEPYMQIALSRMVKKRGGWLVVLFLGELLTATAMGFFESEIAKAVVLALFVPLIISSGGNSGSQATTLIIRALALGEVKLNDWWKVLRREIVVGLLLGCILGTIGFLRIGLWSAFSTMYGPHWALVGLTVGFSLVGIVMWGSIAGSMLPFVLRKIGFDPATASAPFVATLVDVTGLIIYFSVALIFLRGTLL